MLLLALVFGLIGIALVTVVVSASAVHLERKQLLAVADAAALDAADALDEVGYYSDATGAQPDGGVPLTDASVRASVQQYLTAAGVGFDGLSVGAPTGTPDGQTAQVTLLAVARLPLVSSVLAPWSDGVPLQVTARARTDLG